MGRKKRVGGGGGRTLWALRCPACLSRLPYGWRAAHQTDDRDILAKWVGGDRGIRVTDAVSYFSDDGQPFLRAWVLRLREVLYRLDSRPGRRLVLRTPVYVPRIVESYSPAREPEPTVSGTGRLLT